jgi:hypothetical protein
MFIAKNEYKKHLYNIKLKAFSDYQFVLEAFLQTPQSFFYIDKTIVNYRLEGISAQMKIYNRLAEGYIARRNAEMSLVENLLSLIIRSIYFIFQKYFIK